MKPSIQRELDELRRQIDELRRRPVVRNATMRGTGLAGSPIGVAFDGYTFIGRQKLDSTTSGSIYVPTAGVTAIMLQMVGGGGGGGGRSNVISSMGGGGAGGEYILKWIVGPFTNGVYRCGPGGIGGVNSTGSDGTGTTFSINGASYLAKGGAGGGHHLWNGGQAGGGEVIPGGSGSADLRYQMTGHVGAYLDNSGGAVIFWGGAGGDSHFGAGGGEQFNNSNGFQPTGYGSGGGGSRDGIGSAGFTGSWGAPGLIFVDEYISF